LRCSRLVVLGLCAAAVLAIHTSAEVGPRSADCRSRSFYWSRSEPAVNLRHVFCGELRNGRPRGFHSLRLRETSLVVRDIQRRREEHWGIYSAIVVFANGRRKLSTFFPDRCSVDQIVRSIAYAATNPIGQHSEWGGVGPSAPAPGAEMFCLDNHGEPFEIRVGAFADGRINTAFPN
jgi:hypothetical protein